MLWYVPFKLTFQYFAFIMPCTYLLNTCRITKRSRLIDITSLICIFQYLLWIVVGLTIFRIDWLIPNTGILASCMYAEPAEAELISRICKRACDVSALLCLCLIQQNTFLVIKISNAWNEIIQNKQILDLQKKKKSKSKSLVKF